MELPERSLLNDDPSLQNEPSNWHEHLQDYDWQSNLKALQLELESPHNFRWEQTLQVVVEWPAMRKWALQMLHKCLTGRAKELSKQQQQEFLNLFQACPPEKRARLTFIEPISIVENMETLANNNTKEHESTQVADEQGDEAQSNVGSQIWSIDPGIVDPPLFSAGDVHSLMGDPLHEHSFDDWEPSELKALDWQANMDALNLELKNPYNREWDTVEALNIKDPALRQWASQTLLECLDYSHRLTDQLRKEFLRLFVDKMPQTALRRLVFQQPMEEDGLGKRSEDDDNQRIHDDQSSDGSSVYL
jgi:hypothetical protein